VQPHGVYSIVYELLFHSPYTLIGHQKVCCSF